MTALLLGAGALAGAYESMANIPDGQSSVTPAVAAPYAQSVILGSMSWNMSTKSRYAAGTLGGDSGNDTWDSTLGGDGYIYSAWGDGSGFTGTQQYEIGISRLSGTPGTGSFAGADVYRGTVKDTPCGAQRSTVGGKPRGLVALPNATMYMFHSTQDLCTSNAWLARSTNVGGSMTWTDHISGLQWPDINGFSPAAILQYGNAQAGALAPDSTARTYIYIYANNASSPGSSYLARVPASPANSIESLRNWSYFSGIDAAGNPTWGSSSATAMPVWTDPNHAETLLVTFNKAIGRYLAYNDHGNGDAGVPAERQVSLFDAPSPWGPWTTFDYEDEFDNSGCASNCLGNGGAVGWAMMQNWFGPDGLSIWPIYSSTGAYDSLNLIKGSILLAATNSTVTGLTVSTGTPAVLDQLSLSDPGNLQYIDRTYRFTSIPAAYLGKEIIRLANNDKVNDDASYLTFTNTRAQNVCVAWDSANPLPKWLWTWNKTGTTLGGASTFTVHSKAFAAGPVTLPGADASNVYIVFIGC